MTGEAALSLHPQRLLWCREEHGEQITVMFDCRNAGLKNMDMEFIQFIISTMKDYYPDPLNYILVFEMPWVLNGKPHT